MSRVLSRFVAYGARIFTPGHTFGRVPFQPILYFFLWAAAVRIATDHHTITDIPFRAVFAGWTETMWDILSIASPMLGFLGWFFITHRPPRAKLAGHWLRLTADVGMFVTVLTYHAASSLAAGGWRDDSTIYGRYLTASVIAFLAVLVIRDIWILVVIDRLAAGLRDGRFK